MEGLKALSLNPSTTKKKKSLELMHSLAEKPPSWELGVLINDSKSWKKRKVIFWLPEEVGHFMTFYERNLSSHYFPKLSSPWEIGS
jgi:hypothetical protein